MVDKILFFGLQLDILVVEGISLITDENKTIKIKNSCNEKYLKLTYITKQIIITLVTSIINLGSCKIISVLNSILEKILSKLVNFSEKKYSLFKFLFLLYLKNFQKCFC